MYWLLGKGIVSDCWLGSSEAVAVAEILKEGGHEITSTWIYGSFAPTRTYSEKQRRDIADREIQEISNSEAMVLISCDERVPGGKFVEAGVALGQKIPIYIIGRRENMLLWASDTTVVPSANEIPTVEELEKKAQREEDAHGEKMSRLFDTLFQEFRNKITEKHNAMQGGLRKHRVYGYCNKCKRGVEVYSHSSGWANCPRCGRRIRTHLPLIV